MPKEITIMAYKASELSEKAKDSAYYKWLNGRNFGRSSDYQKTLDAFCEHFPIKVTDWEVSTHSHSFATMRFTGKDGESSLSGIRLMAKLYTRYSDALLKGRYFSLWSKTDQNPHWSPGAHCPWGKLKSRHSKVMMERRAGTLTGFCADESILEPIYGFLDKPDDRNFGQLLQECLDKWVEDYQEDMESSSTEEAFLEEAEANDWLFDENGRML